MPYNWVDIDQDEESRWYVQQVNDGKQIIPTIVLEDGSILVEPTNAELAAKLEVRPRMESKTPGHCIGGLREWTPGITGRQGHGYRRHGEAEAGRGLHLHRPQPQHGFSGQDCEADNWNFVTSGQAIPSRLPPSYVRARQPP